MEAAIKWQLNKMVAPCVRWEGACCEVPLGEQDGAAHPTNRRTLCQQGGGDDTEN